MSQVDNQQLQPFRTRPKHRHSIKAKPSAQALKTRLAVLNEKSQPSVAMVIHTCHESDAIVDEDLSNGAANKELDPHRSSPRKVTRVERTLHRKRMLAARRIDVLPEVFFPWPRLRPMLKDYTPMLRLSS